ncbi:MAG: hypothetical protein WA191_19115, partial [Telluria sp.]
MRQSVRLSLRNAGLSALLLGPIAHGHAQQPPDAAHALAAQLKIVKQQLAEQRELLDALMRQVAARETQLNGQPAAGGASLALQRGTGNGQAQGASQA